MRTHGPTSTGAPGGGTRPTLRECEAQVRATFAMLEAHAGAGCLPPVQAAAYAWVIEQMHRATARHQLVAARLADRAPVTDLTDAQLSGIREAFAVPGAFADGHTGLPAESLTVPRGKPRFRNTADFLDGMLGIGLTAARRRLEASAVLLPGTTTGGQPAPARYPNLAEGLVSGSADPQTTISVAKRLDMLSPTIQKHPDARERMARVEAEFAEAVRTGSPRTAYKIIEAIENREEQGGALTAAELRARQGLHYLGRKHGLYEYLYCCDGLQHEAMQNLCDIADNPHLAEHGTRTPFTDPPARKRGGQEAGAPMGGSSFSPSTAAANDGVGLPAPDWAVGAGIPEADRPHSTLSHGTGPDNDPVLRTPAQRRLDAVIDAIRFQGGSKGPRRGIAERTRLIVLIDYRVLLGQLEKAGITAHGSPISPQEARELAVRAGIIPVVLGGKGEVLDVGRTRRRPTAAQEVAVLARDIGCPIPDCTMPISRSDIHHAEAWKDGGRTDIGNLVGGCTNHHHAIHIGRYGVAFIGGVPYVVPPADVDPLRRPVRNLYWRPELAGNPYPPGHGPNGEPPPEQPPRRVVPGRSPGLPE